MKYLPALFLVTTVATAQTTVVPAWAADLEGNSLHAYPLSFTQVRTQILIDGRAISNSGRILRNVAFRPDGGGSVGDFAAKTLKPKVTLYAVPTTAAAMSRMWQSNVGTATGTVVFDGNLSLPAYQRRFPTPLPWLPAIVFARPYLFNPTTGNLLIDWEETAPYVFSRYNVDAVTYPKQPGVLVSRVWYNRLNCKNARGDSAQLSLSRTGGTLGGTLPVRYTMRPATGGMLDTMLLMIGDTNKRLGTVPLPIDLTALGYRGCSLAIQPLLGIVGTSSPISIRIPNDASLAGLVLFFQGIAVDSRLGNVVPTEDAWYARMIPNPPTSQSFQSVYRNRYTNQADGFQSASFFYAPVLKFE